MATELDVQSTPNVTAAISAPDVIHSLDTNTGPQAQPQSFGASMGGLVQGMKSATDSLHQAGREVKQNADQMRAAQDENAAMAARVELDKRASTVMTQQKIAGTPANPEAFDNWFGQQRDQLAQTLTTPGSQAAFNRGSAQMGLDYFHQNLGEMAGQQLQAKALQAHSIFDSLASKAESGQMPADDALNAITNYGQIASTALPGVPAIQESQNAAAARAVTAGVSNVAQTQGPGAAALTLRGGYGGAYIPPVSRELLATSADNQQSIALGARTATAQQAVDALSATARSGGHVDPQASMAASTELAKAQAAQPVDTKQPELTDFLQSRMNHYSDLESQIGGSPLAEAQPRHDETHRRKPPRTIDDTALRGDASSAAAKRDCEDGIDLRPGS